MSPRSIRYANFQRGIASISHRSDGRVEGCHHEINSASEPMLVNANRLGKVRETQDSCLKVRPYFTVANLGRDPSQREEGNSVPCGLSFALDDPVFVEHRMVDHRPPLRRVDDVDRAVTRLQGDRVGEVAGAFGEVAFPEI